MSNFKINTVKNIKYPDHDDIVYVKNNCKQKKNIVNILMYTIHQI